MNPDRGIDPRVEEYELEVVMRDLNDNRHYRENFKVHTGDSLTVAPAHELSPTL